MDVAIVGASGYAGGELIRLLMTHPEAEVTVATSRALEGRPVTDQHPHLRGYTDCVFTNPAAGDIEADFAFLAVPHTAAMNYVSPLLERGIRVVDLSADYRLPRDVYERIYGVSHTDWFEAPYGLPEISREGVKNARFVSNPGCFPTGATLAAAPLAPHAAHVIYDSKTGVSGAGDNPSATTHYPNVADGINPYKWTSHRHLAEMKQELARLGSTAACYFTPHLVPVNRGILTTAHILLDEPMGQEEVEALYREFYRGEYFVRLQRPMLSAVRGSNFCDIAVESEGSRVVAVSAIDNLVKGAAGQAIQNMNIMCGYAENAGLTVPPCLP
ncbi:N-acetyl-gamma-glutamyl-phosphate reductase [Methanofollis fontis]|uniref:N-acetyl-gamma-glutamyl-phosphate reductase n=1 Tax=Methanofollis fontis TaxID=2052832 RepID=A0A483CTB4_9EURY|nr:N-acetyl-gamma-glutamyl-phosphate reductase [Methanofollis fontis]TAJ45594.1 N-acetyl-gamma-glutamyl-phosphate reductase [Methanofollis fontis]